MFVNQESILYILFELTLFFLLLIVLHWLFKQSIQPALIDYINKTKKYWHNLNNNKNLLAKTNQSTTDKIQKQNKTLNKLETKIKKWHTALLKREEKKIIKKEKLIKNILEKRKQKKRALHIIKLQQEIIPKSVKLAHQEMQEKYSNKEGSILLEKLLMQMAQKTG